MSQFKIRENLVWLLIAALFVTLLLPYPLLHSPQTDSLKKTLASGKLVVVTVTGPTTIYKGSDGEYRGFDYDLVSEFAEFLGVESEVVFAENIQEMSGMLATGRADVTIAGLQDTPENRLLFLFSDPYKKVQHHVVYLRGGQRPRKIKALYDREIEVPGGSGAIHILKKLKKNHPKLSWSVSTSGYEELLTDLWQGLVDISVVPNDVLKVMQQHLPQLSKGLALGNPGKLVMGFSSQDSGAIVKRANDFLKTLKKNGGLKRLEQRYYDAAAKATYFNLAHFNAQIDQTLPDFKDIFMRHARTYDMDWKMLAAMAYQESQWDPDAISPTGVEGLMMLTNGTAELMKIDDRKDPDQSIRGGAQYIAGLRDKLADTIKEPDRTWIALAAYNVGLGHILDARDLARQNGKNPDFWSELEVILPLLEEDKWAKKTKHGKARGREPVQYVNRIRSFYDILVKHDEEAKKEESPVTQPSAL